jgi:hypothetical protein
MYFVDFTLCYNDYDDFFGKNLLLFPNNRNFFKIKLYSQRNILYGLILFFKKKHSFFFKNCYFKLRFKYKIDSKSQSWFCLLACSNVYYNYIFFLHASFQLITHNLFNRCLFLFPYIYIYMLFVFLV